MSQEKRKYEKEKKTSKRAVVSDTALLNIVNRDIDQYEDLEESAPLEHFQAQQLAQLRDIRKLLYHNDLTEFNPSKLAAMRGSIEALCQNTKLSRRITQFIEMKKG
jgi:hypothetical protein